MERIKNLCIKFHIKNYVKHYYANHNCKLLLNIPDIVRNTFQIENSELVYLAYNASVGNTFMQGFIITDKGLYCKTINSQSFVSYEKFLNTLSITYGECCIFADWCIIAYAYGMAQDELESLVELYEDIKKILQNFTPQFYIK